jgi:hypothetical protein
MKSVEDIYRSFCPCNNEMIHADKYDPIGTQEAYKLDEVYTA